MGAWVEAVVPVADLVAQGEMDVRVVQRVEELAIVDSEDAGEERDEGCADGKECDRKSQPGDEAAIVALIRLDMRGACLDRYTPEQRCG